MLTILESGDKNFTNHSVRKTVANKLKKATVEPTGIVKITGHKNIQSLDDYVEAKKRRATTAFVCHTREELLQSITDSIQRSSSTAESANSIATDFDAQFISNCRIKAKFHIAQSDNDKNSRAKSVTGFDSAYVVHGTACVHRKLYRKVTDGKKIVQIINYLI